MTVFREFIGPGHCRLTEITEEHAVVYIFGGIGDILLGLTATRGLQLQKPERKVVYVVKPSKYVEWALPFYGYDYLAAEVPEGVESALLHDGGDKYAQQMSELTRRGRVGYYAASCGPDVVPTLPQVRPVREEERNWSEKYRDVVVLAPWSIWKDRTWPLPHWILLERLLRDSGYRVVIIDNTRDRNRLFQGEVLTSEPAARITALLGCAALVIGNNSGMVCVSGLQHTPTIALCSQIDGRKVFSICPSITVINAPLECMDCHWAGPYYRPICNSICANLAAIMPHDVASYALAILRQRQAPAAAI